MTPLIGLNCPELGAVNLHPHEITVWTPEVGDPFYTFDCGHCDHPHSGNAARIHPQLAAAGVRTVNLARCTELVDRVRWPFLSGAVDARDELKEAERFWADPGCICLEVPPDVQRWAVALLAALKASESFPATDGTTTRSTP